MKNKIVQRTGKAVALRIIVAILNPVISVLWAVNLFISQSIAQKIVSIIFVILFAFLTGLSVASLIIDNTEHNSEV